MINLFSGSPFFKVFSMLLHINSGISSMVFDVFVEQMHPQNSEAIVAFTKKCWQHDYNGIIDQDLLDGFPEDKFLEGRKFILNQSDCSCLMAVTGSGEIHGFSDAGKARGNTSEQQDVGEIYALYTHPDFQRRGTGTRLFESQVSFFKDKGFKRFVIWTLEDNRKARSFYEKMGGLLSLKESRPIFGKDYSSVMYVWDLKNE